jgi:hypothetical protein
MDCKEILWIGQAGTYAGRLYEDEPHRIALTKFLFAHCLEGEEKHRLQFYELDRAPHGYDAGWKWIIVPDSDGTYSDVHEDDIRFDDWLKAKQEAGNSNV